MNEWHFYAYLFAHFDVTFLATVQKLAQSVLAYVQVPLVSSVTLYIAGTTAQEFYRPNGNPIFFLQNKLIRALVVMVALTTATYNDLAIKLLLNAIPNELTAAVAGAVGNGPLAPNAFDKMWGGSWAASVQSYKAISGWSPKSFGLLIVIAMYIACSAVSIFYAFMIFMGSHVLLGIAVIVGGLFILCILWPRTEKYFNGWLAVVGSLIVTQVLVVALLSVLMTQSSDIIGQITKLNGDPAFKANDEFAQLHYLVEAGLMFFALGYLSKRMPEMAQAIMSGIATEIAPVTSMAGGMMSAVRGGASNPSRSGAPSGGAAGLRSIQPVGAAP